MVTFPKRFQNNTFFYSSAINITECTDEQYNLFFQEEKLDLLRYFCVTTTLSYSLQINDCMYASPEYPGSIYCTNPGGGDAYKYFIFYLAYEKFNKYNNENHLELQIIKMENIPRSQSMVYITSNGNVFENDIGLFYPVYERFNYTEASATILNDFGNYFGVILSKYAPSSLLIHKRTVRLHEQLLSLLSTLKLLYFIFKLINSVITDYHYTKYLLDMYIESNLTQLQEQYINELNVMKIGNFILTY
jgi:hypothetical protein